MNTKQKILEGVIVPMVTPITAAGDVDYEGAVELAKWLVHNGMDGLFLAGTTGRFSHFTPLQNMKICSAVAKAVGNQVTIYGGACDSGLHRILENVRLMKEAGADFVVTTAPYYLPYAMHEAEDVLRKVADVSPLPVIYYNIPPFVGYGLRAEFLTEMADHPNVVGYKDSANDIVHHLDVLKFTKDKSFNVLSGKEKTFIEGFKAGSKGLVVAFANVYPKLYADLLQSVKQGNWSQAEILQKKAIQNLEDYYIAAYNARPVFSTMMIYMEDLLRNQGIQVKLS
ncbi:dihydrodipicolinate synthase family protein [Paenibacillus psychroresistens]|uniref:dihydrodipicolinate synthase family protein n=1 Tax=Paenibacillus psychroresistens TaxID=1778678 RepID=UPI0013911701|nr:dihydrodipicolinate synthase family protein [Paenibacillus psychroresistens]